MTTKLNSMRFLEANGVPYEAREFDSSLHDAMQVAQALGVPAQQVYKTLVVEKAAGARPMLVMVAADRHLNLKKFAAAIGQKKVTMASHADAERLTGLQVGGISALALVQKRWEVYLDKPGASLEHIFISAGQRGLNVRVPVADLIRVLNVKVVEATDDPA